MRKCFSGSFAEARVDFQARWRKGVVWTGWIVKHGADGVGETLWCELEQDEADT